MCDCIMNSISGSFMVSSCGMFVLQLIAHAFSLVQLLAHELFELILLYSNSNFSSNATKEKSYVPGGANTTLICESMSRTRRTRISNSNWKKMMRLQPRLNPRKERLKKYSWLVYEKNGNYSCTCTAESVQRLGNLTEWASKPSAEI